MKKLSFWSLVKKFWMCVPLAILLWNYTHTRQELVRVKTTLTTTQTTLKKEREAYKEERKKAEATSKKAEKRYKQDLQHATEKYHQDLDRLKPVVTQSKKTVNEYAKTPAGQSTGLDTDGVRRFQEQRNLLRRQSTPTTS